MALLKGLDETQIQYDIKDLYVQSFSNTVSWAQLH